MKGRPWYKRYPSDFLNGTMALNVSEKGAYNVVLDLMYDRGGPIPDDPRWLARQCGCSMQQWRTLLAGLVGHGKLFVTEDGRLSNERAIEVIDKNQAEAAALRQAGRAGGLARKLDKTSGKNGTEHNDTNEIASERLEPTDSGRVCVSATGKLVEMSRLVGDNPDLFGAEVVDISGLGIRRLEAVPEARVRKKKESSLRSGATCPPLPSAEKRGTRLTTQWKPSQQTWEFAIARGVDPQAALEEFVTYWPARPGREALKLDWDMTFRNRVIELARLKRYPIVVSVVGQKSATQIELERLSRGLG